MLKFWDPFIFLERLKIETSYLMHSSSTTCSRQSMINWSLMWAWSRSLALNFKFGTLHNLWNDKHTRSKFCVRIHYLKPFVGKWKLIPKGARLRSYDIHSFIRVFNVNTVKTQWFNKMQCIQNVITSKCIYITYGIQNSCGGGYIG